MLTPSTTLFKYKRGLQTFDYTARPILCKTSEGLEMTLSITSQFQIQKSTLLSLHARYGREDLYLQFLSSLTQAAVQAACPLFSGSDYFGKRGEIERGISKKIVEFYNSSNAYSIPLLLQLRNVAHPKEYTSANEAKEAVQQEKERVLSLRQEVLTRAQTDLIKVRKKKFLFSFQSWQLRPRFISYLSIDIKIFTACRLHLIGTLFLFVLKQQRTRT